MLSNVNVAFCINDSYSKYCSVALGSVLENISSDIEYNIYIISFHAISVRNKTRFLAQIEHCPNNVNLVFLEIADHFLNIDLPIRWHFTPDIYLRLAIPDVLSSLERVVYLDADIIVERDISELFATPLGSAPIGAVHTFVPKWRSTHKHLSDMQDVCESIDDFMIEIGIDNLDNYINSGVLVMDLKKLRVLKFFDRAIEMIKIRKYIFPDQDILNSLLWGEILLIDPRWNILSGNNSAIPQLEYEIYYESKSIDWKNPFLIHYAGDKKPWLSSDGYFCDRFWHYAQKSPFFDQLILEKN